MMLRDLKMKKLAFTLVSSTISSFNFFISPATMLHLSSAVFNSSITDSSVKGEELNMDSRRLPTSTGTPILYNEMNKKKQIHSVCTEEIQKKKKQKELKK